MKRGYISFIFIILTLAILMVGSSAYETEGHSWSHSNSDPFVVIQITGDVPSNWTDPIVSAGNSWNDVEEDFTYTFTPDDSENYVTIGSVDGDGDALAETTVNVWGDVDPSTIDNGHITFDETEDFSINDAPSTFDVESIAAHELGHLLGLGHTNVDYNGYVNAPTMISGAPASADGYLKTLEQDDIDGINSIY